MAQILHILLMALVGALALAPAQPAQAQNTLLGTGAGASLTSGTFNTLLGQNAGAALTTSGGNTLVGDLAGESTTESGNTMVGPQAGGNNTTGQHNAILGGSASSTTGSDNTFFGPATGGFNQPGSRNVYVGYNTGFFTYGSNYLLIENDPLTIQSSSLIYGQFDNDLVAIKGALGVGTQIPMDHLHVRDGNLRIEQTGATHAILNFVANGKTWEIKNNQATGRLTFYSPGGGATTASFKFDRQAVENLLRVGVVNALTVDINGNLVVTGGINPDYVFTPEYDLESIEAHAAYMWAHRHLPAVGPGQLNAEGQGMVNVGQRSQGMLEELEKLHIYIAQLKGEGIHQDDQIAALTREVTELQANEPKLAALKRKMIEKESRLKRLRGELTALKGLVHHLMSPNSGAATGDEE